MDNKNKKNNKAKPVAKCDQLGKVVANSCLGKRPVGPSGDHLKRLSQNVIS